MYIYKVSTKKNLIFSFAHKQIHKNRQCPLRVKNVLEWACQEPPTLLLPFAFRSSCSSCFLTSSSAFSFNSFENFKIDDPQQLLWCAAKSVYMIARCKHQYVEPPRIASANVAMGRQHNKSNQEVSPAFTIDCVISKPDHDQKKENTTKNQQTLFYFSISPALPCMTKSKLSK